MITGFTLQLWAEAITTAVYLRNRLPNRSISMSTPYESLYKQKPSINHLRPYRVKCFVHIPEEKRKAGTKLQPRADQGYLVGYTNSNKIYRIYLPSQHKIIESRQIHWIKQQETPIEPKKSNHDDEQFATLSPLQTPYVPSKKDEPRRIEDEQPGEVEVQIPPIPDRPEEYERLPSPSPTPEPDEPQPQSRPQRSRQPPDRFGFGRVQSGVSRKVETVLDDDPTTYQQAIKSELKDEWMKAMEYEIKALEKSGTYDKVPKPEGRKIIDSKWVYKTKRNADSTLERYRARTVAKGFSQIPGYDYDEVFAPVIRYESLRFLLAICAKNGWRPRQFDVKSAFLYGELKEEVFMRPPPGFEDGKHVWKLKRCLYGLKQSAREWYALLSRYLKTKGFNTTSFDPCVFVHNKHEVYLSVYVDDIAIYSADVPFTATLIQDLKMAFEITDLGEALLLLGIHITYSDKGIHLTQQRYAETILLRYGFHQSRTVSTPLPKGIRLRKGTEDERIPDITLYQSIIGSLMYLTTGTRPDLAHTISFLSQYSSCPNESHLNALKHVLRYLNGTKHLSLFYPANNSTAICCCGSGGT